MRHRLPIEIAVCSIDCTPHSFTAATQLHGLKNKEEREFIWLKNPTCTNALHWNFLLFCRYLLSMTEALHPHKIAAKPRVENLCDLNTVNGLESASIRCRGDANIQQPKEAFEILSRPILVGYAFGPKKMSTMGVVMAEASKTHLSSVSTTVLVEEGDQEEEGPDHDQVEEKGKFTVVCGNDDDHDSASLDHQQEHVSSTSLPTHGAEDAKVTGVGGSIQGYPANPCSSPRRICHDTNKNANIVLSLGSYSGGLQNIVRYLHSSCSSVDTNSTTTTLLTTGTFLTTVTPSSASTSGRIGVEASICSGRSSNATSQQRLRVSFVPLDPDLPLEGQHGAKMDIILHKLTEDILWLSKFSPLYPDLMPSLGLANGYLEHRLEELQPRLPSDAKGGILRVHRLMQYQKRYPDCSMADDPAKVLTLMSRSDIAHALEDCLVGVRSASGITVASPKFVVWQPKTTLSLLGDCMDHTDKMMKRLRDAEMSYPLIAKPLQAAGTKISHHMTVLLQQSALYRIQNSCCLVQEYANHDSILYKVYVLGNNVHVFQRASLPNLPLLLEKEGVQHQQGPGYVDFDSQRPYPRLSAFGVGNDFLSAGAPPLYSTPPPSSPSSNLTQPPTSSCPGKSQMVAVTSEEVQPIVNVLKRAFGLELFGFDILMTSVDNKDFTASSEVERRMLVVDVNYFPSYKEVSNFPSLLAQYLTQRAIDCRRKTPHG